MDNNSVNTFTPVLRAEFSDVDDMCAAVKSWRLEFEPLDSLAGNTRVGQIIQSQIGGIEFGHARFSTNLEQHGSAPEGSITFVVMERTMQRHLWWRGQDTDCRDILVMPMGSELFSLSANDFDIHTVAVPLRICQAICEASKIGFSVISDLSTVFRPAPAVLDNLRTALRVMKLENAAPGTAEANAIVEILISAWVKAQMPKVRRRPEARVRTRAMGRIMERFDDADWIDLTPSELCSYAQVSERTLQYAFKERFGMTPAKYLKARRLAAVRSALKNPANRQMSVGAVAGQFNFWHVGQFAADYRRAFGELPSETLLSRTEAR